VFFVTLVFPGVRPSYGLWHGQEHGHANKQGIRSPKIEILAIQTPPVTLQLFFMPSDHRVMLLFMLLYIVVVLRIFLCFQ